MSVGIITVPRVYLAQKHLQKSAHHRAYAPAPTQPNAQPGADQAVIVLEFWNGVARDVPSLVYEQFKDLGIATTERPLSRWEQAELEGR